MTLASTVNRNDYIGNGATSVFPYTYRVFSNTDLLVTVRDLNGVETTLTLTTDYTVDGVGDSGGGNVTLVDAGQGWLDGTGDLLTGYAITLRRVRPFTQETDIRNQGEFFPETHEDAFDHFVMLAQELDNRVDGAFRLPETIDPSTISTVLPVPQADAFIRWNSSADGLENAQLGDLSATIIPGANGMVSFTLPNAFSARNIVAGDGSISVANGDGQAGNPSITVPALGISTAKIADDAVDAAKLKDDASVDANRSVTADHIRNNAVVSDKINALAVTEGKLADDAVSAAKLRDDASVDANRAVTTDHIRDANVTNAKLAANAVNTTNIVDGAVTGPKLGSGVQRAVAANATALGGTGTIISHTFPSGTLSPGDRITIKTAGRVTGAISHVRIKANGSQIVDLNFAVTPGGNNFMYGDLHVHIATNTQVFAQGRVAHDAPAAESNAEADEVFGMNTLTVSDISSNALTIAVDILGGSGGYDRNSNFMYLDEVP